MIFRLLRLLAWAYKPKWDNDMRIRTREKFLAQVKEHNKNRESEQ